MQITCPISGVKMLRAPYLLGLHYAEEHPIFRTPRHTLVKDNTFLHFFERSRDEEERRLIFLGFLNASDLVTFTCIATPPVETVSKHFIDLYQMVSWLDWATYELAKEISFPRYIVRPDNATLDNVQVWLGSMREIRSDFESKTSKRDLARRAVDERNRISAEITRAIINDQVFNTTAANWVMEYTGLDKHPQAKSIRDLLLTKKSNAPYISQELLYKVKDLIVEEIDVNHPIFPLVVGQLNQLLQANKAGFTFEVEEEMVIDVETGVKTSVDVGTASVKWLEDHLGSTGEPQRSSFPSGDKGQWGWIQATARWKLAQRAPRYSAASIKEAAEAIDAQPVPTEDRMMWDQEQQKMIGGEDGNN